MFDIVFYEDKKGVSKLKEYIIELSKNKEKSKDSKIKFEKITDYIQALGVNGVALGKPYVKYLGDDIWELRPLKDRILFATVQGNTIVLLHHFMKKTQKTPTREIEKAKKELKYFKENYN